MLHVEKDKDSTIKVINGRIELDNLIFFIVENNSTLRIEHLIGYDALIIDAQDLVFTRMMIKKLRSQFNPEYYLKPIILLNPRETNDPIIKTLTDGILFSIEQIKELTSTVKQIFFRTTQLDYNAPSNFHGQMIKKVFNFMFTRDMRTLAPQVDLSSSIGYTYPELSVNFEGNEEAQVLEILDWAEKEGLIWPDFHDRVYLCNSCSNGFLIYREVCPHCNSSNTSSQDLIHHFPCAFIGPVSDFRNNVDNAMVCPKCHKNLRHIGVDYDKPSVINHCNNCDKNFQDFYVKAKCLACQQDTDVQFLVPRSIYVYKLTKKGRTTAVNGIFTSNEYIEDVQGSINMETYHVLLHYQLERVRNNSDLRSHIAVMHFENIWELYNKVGKKSHKKLLEDIIHVMREHIKSSDYIAVENPTTIHLCINDVDLSTAQRLVNKMEITIKELIKENFSGFELFVRSVSVQMQTRISAEKQVKELSKELFE